MKFSKILIFILLTAFVIRLIGLNQSFWLDEAITTLAARDYDLVDLVTTFSKGDFHPPLHYILEWFWGRMFGFSEISMRLPSVILGVLTVWLVFLIGKKLFDQKTGLMAAFLLTIAPLHVYYSQEARMYSLTAFTVALSYYFFIKIIDQYPKRVEYLGFMMATVLVLYSDYIAYFIFPAQFVYLVWNKKEYLKRYLQLTMTAAVCILFWVPIFFQQLEVGKATSLALPEWSKIVGGATGKELGLLITKTIIGRISFENKFLYAAIVGVVGVFYTLILFLSVKKINNGVKLLLSWIFVPVMLAFLISFSIPILSYFRMLYVLPAFYVLLARGFLLIPNNLFKPALVITLCINVLFLGIFFKDPKFHREDWKNASLIVGDLSDSNSLILFENNTLPFVYKYYAKKDIAALPGLTRIPVKAQDDVIDLNNYPNITKLLVFEYLVDITDKNRLLESVIVTQGFNKKETLNFNGVGFVNIYKR